MRTSVGLISFLHSSFSGHFSVLLHCKSILFSQLLNLYMVCLLFVFGRFSPGRFDILFASHQWWHIFIISAAVIWWWALKNYFLWRMEQGPNQCSQHEARLQIIFSHLSHKHINISICITYLLKCKKRSNSSESRIILAQFSSEEKDLPDRWKKSISKLLRVIMIREENMKNEKGNRTRLKKGGRPLVQKCETKTMHPTYLLRQIDIERAKRRNVFTIKQWNL